MGPEGQILAHDFMTHGLPSWDFSRLAGSLLAGQWHLRKPERSGEVKWDSDMARSIVLAILAWPPEVTAPSFPPGTPQAQVMVYLLI